MGPPQFSGQDQRGNSPRSTSWDYFWFHQTCDYNLLKKLPLLVSTKPLSALSLCVIVSSLLLTGSSEETILSITKCYSQSRPGITDMPELAIIISTTSFAVKGLWNAKQASSTSLDKRKFTWMEIHNEFTFVKIWGGKCTRTH